jgi:putative photosynthetic complex assembly protein 2
VADHALPALYALFLWWLSTGVILYLDRLPRRTFRWSMLGATALAAAALYGLAAGADDASALGAYTAFTCALAVWGWHETSFLMGFVTGPRTTSLPEGCTGRRRFVLATGTVLHHELAIAATAALVLALTWGAPNQVGAWTFLALWALRLSAKLNLFLGVANTAEALLPEHLRYLASYFGRRPMNALFPASAAASTAAALALLSMAALAEAGAPAASGAVGLTMLGTLVALGALEHWLLVLPLSADALWSRWARPVPTR